MQKRCLKNYGYHKELYGLGFMYINNEQSGIQITFNRVAKSMFKGKLEIGKFGLGWYVKGITTKELKAINKQVEELGW